MHLRVKSLTIALVVSLATVATAQSDAPTLAPASVLQLQTFELRAENLTLKMQLLQADFGKLQAEAAAYAQTLQRPGYTISRGEDGGWRYLAVPKGPAAQEPKQ